MSSRVNDRGFEEGDVSFHVGKRIDIRMSPSCTMYDVESRIRGEDSSPFRKASIDVAEYASPSERGVIRDESNNFAFDKRMVVNKSVFSSKGFEFGSRIVLFCRLEYS
jgi:hypothetical protein